MDREQWNQEFIDFMHKKTGCSLDLCRDSAAASDDYFNDGVSPEDAVDEELSYWD